MKTVTLTAEIAADGKLVLELSTGLPPGPAEVVVVVHPTPARSVASPRPVVDAAESRDRRRRAVQEAIDRARTRDSAAGPESAPPTGLEIPSKTCSGLFLDRLPDDDDADGALEELNARWKAKLDDLRIGPDSLPRTG